MKPLKPVMKPVKAAMPSTSKTKGSTAMVSAPFKKMVGGGITPPTKTGFKASATPKSLLKAKI